MKTLIAIPCMDQVDVSFTESLLHLQRGDDVSALFCSSSLIYDSRNKLLLQAYEAGAEYILWLDSDMTFKPDTLMRLYEDIEDKDFVSGLYFRRKPMYKPVIFKDARYEFGEGKEVIPIAEDYLDYPKDSLFEIAACGFGCVLMRTSMYKTIWEKSGLPFSPILGFGEDISFCIKAREAGYKLYCDSSIKCGHTGHVIITEEIYDTWRQLNVK